MNEAVQVNIDEHMQVRFEKREAVLVVGVRGDGPKDEKRLFAEIEARGSEIAHKKSDNHYLVIIPNGLIVAHAVTDAGSIPKGMISYTIPADEYAVCRFEEKYIGSFWGQVCKDPVKSKYNLNMAKTRFEIFAPHLQPQGITEIYMPTNAPAE